MTTLLLIAAAVVASFDNAYVKWTMGDDARVTSLYEKASKRELVKDTAAFVAYVDAAGGLHEATSCKGSKDRLDFGFPGGASISLKVTPFKGGWTFETADAKLGDAVAVWFVRLKPACAEYFGKFANAISDDTSAVFVRGYEAKTEMYCAGPVAGAGVEDHAFTGVPNGSNILCAGAMKKFGFGGHKAGLAVAKRDKILGVMKEMTLVSGAPWSKAGGAWAQESDMCRGSYLFGTSMDLPSVDDWVALAERGGFDLFHFHVWWKLYGSYEIDTDCFPNGVKDLQVAAKKFRDAGFRVGTHTLSACIEWGSKCLTPVCDTNLITTYTYTLAKPLSPTDTVIVVNEPFWDKQAVVFSGRMGAVKGNGNTFRIGNELVQYWEADPAKKTFGGVKRGVFECQRDKYPVTIGGTYPAGTKIHYLRNAYSSFYPEPDSPLMDETIARINDVYNACDMEEIYFDGSEGMGERYAVDRMRERIFRSLKQGKNGIINEASCRNPYHWWFRSRLWPWDHNWYGAKSLQDLHVRTTMRQVVKEDFFAANTGWWAPLLASELQRGHFLDEMEYFMCKNVAHDVSMAIQGTYVTDGPLSLNVQNQMTLLGWWERARMAKAFAKGLQDQMKPEGAEFRLRQNNKGSWVVVPFETSVHRAGEAATRKWKVESKEPRNAEIRVEALYGAKAYDDKDAKPLLTAKSKFEIATAKDVKAEVKAGKDAKYGETIVLTAENKGKESYGAWALAAEHHAYPNLVKTDGAFGCWVKGDGSGATLAFRLNLHKYNWGGICEHYVKLDFTGWRYVSFLLRERDADQFAKMKWDISDDWKASRCVYNGPWWSTDPSVEWVKVGLNEVPAGGKTTVEIGEVRQMGVTKPAIEKSAVVVNGTEYALPFAMQAGDYAELANGAWTLCDELGNPKKRVATTENASLVKGANEIAFKSDDAAARVEVTVFALGAEKGAFGAIGKEGRRWLGYEAQMPAVYAPSKGFDAPVVMMPRPGERARLEVEIWGPVDTPSFSVGGRKWTFPVKLGTNEHVICKNGTDWRAEKVVPGKTAEDAGVWFKIAPSQRVKIAEGKLENALPNVEGRIEIKLSAKDPKACEARFEFVKRYLKPYAEWTLDEIKAGVTEAGDDVKVAYPENGFRLASMTEGGVDTSYLGKVGKGRTEFSKVFVVPAAIYDSAKVIVSVDPDKKRDRVFTLRLTRYNEGPGYGGRDFAGMANIVVDFDKAEKRDLGGGKWEVSVPVDMGNIADFVWGGDMFGTWLNNSIHQSDNRVNKEIGNYLDFEILPRLVKYRSPMQDARMCPDASFKNAITIHGATLHKAGVGFEIVQSQTGNVFAADEKPETSVKVTPTAKGAWTLRRVIRDAEGNVLTDATESFDAAKTFTFDLAQKTVGWYALDYTLAKDGKTVLTHKASFALLPPDTRKEGIGEGPYGSWSYGGAHYNFKDIRQYGPLFEKAGLRRCLGIKGKEGHPWKMSPQSVTWDYAQKTDEGQVKAIRQQREDNPNVSMFLMFHEDAPWSYQHAWELTGQKVPDPKTYGNAGWHSPGNDKKGGFAKRAARHEKAMKQCAFMRKHFPEVKITIGNSLACTEIIAEALRDGLPQDYFDYMGIESVVRNQMPEREGDMCYQTADMMMQLAKHFGNDKWRPNATWESGYRTDTLIGLDRQAAWQVRDVLLEQAWRFPDIFIAIITDCGNSYGGSFWGDAGLCYRVPTAYPKPVYVGVATVTRLLDQVTGSKRIPCGDECVYVNEYSRKDGKYVTALWTTRGNAELTLELADKNVEYVDFYGRAFAPEAFGGGWFARTFTKSCPVITAGEFVKYIVSSKPVVVSAKVGKRTFPGWDKEPADAKLVKATDNAADWKVEATTNATIEITTGPFLPYRTLGSADVREVVDAEKGKCLEIELTKPNYNLPLLFSEYAVVELKKPIPLDGNPATIGAWVKGNSGWGQFYWVLEDAKGKRYYSCGQGASADVFDYDGTVSLCYTGWNFLKMPINDKSSVRNLSTGGVGIIWRGGSFSGPMKLAGIAFAAMNRPLFLTERRPYEQKIRVGGIYAAEFAK